MRRNHNGKDKIIIAAALACFSASYFWLWKDDVLRDLVYPLQYDYTVRRCAYENGVSPALVAAVILVESKFNEKASSDRGAAGLMQIMPETGQWIAGEMNLTGYEEDRLKDVQTNIAMGTWYLSYLLEAYGGNKVLALAAYNAGHGQVDEWMESYGWEKNFSEIEKIPFTETREYVKIVLLNERNYKHLYSF